MAFLKDYMLQHKTMTSNLTADDLDETTYKNVEESEVPNFEEESDITLQLNPDVNVDEEIDSEQSSSSHEFKKPKKIKKSSDNLVPDFKKLNNKNQRRFKNAVISTLDQLLDEQETSSSATLIYTSNFSTLYSNNVQPNQQHTIQPQPLNQNTSQTTQFLFSQSPELLSSSEKSTVKYLQDYGLLPCAKQCHKCGSEVKQYQRNDRGKIREVFRCKKKGCQTTQSVRNNNSFFTYEDANGRCNSGLSLSEIMEIVYFWVTENQLVQIIKFTGRSKNTICDWMNLCRDIPVRLFNKRQPFGGPGQIVQIDECLLRGARKNNKGRFRLADLKVAVIPRHEDEEDTNRNYGRRIGGPWVVGLCCVLENGLIDARFFVVEKRDKETLHRIIKNEVLPGTTVHSDSWLGYKGLSEKGYVHETVNHSNNFVDPETDANTQRIESLWRPLRLKIVKKMCGTNEDLLDRYLAEYWWRGLNKTDNIFDAFLRDMKLCFDETTGQASKKYQNWPWTSQLQFLDKTLAPRQTTSNITTDIPLEIQTQELTSSSQITSPQASTSFLDVEESDDPELFSRTDSTLPAPKKIKTNSEEPNDQHVGVNKVISYLENKKKPTHDSVDHLFLSYAGTFKKFSERNQIQIKLELAKLFGDMELKELDERGPSSSLSMHSSISNYSTDCDFLQPKSNAFKNVMSSSENCSKGYTYDEYNYQHL
ncbi:hypothetical protein QTP88_017006 [Uroleucon formosanum]